MTMTNMSAVPPPCDSERASQCRRGDNLISMLGLTGAAVATTIALIVWNVAMALFISRHLRLMPGILGIFGSNRR